MTDYIEPDLEPVGFFKRKRKSEDFIRPRWRHIMMVFFYGLTFFLFSLHDEVLELIFFNRGIIRYQLLHVWKEIALTWAFHIAFIVMILIPVTVLYRRKRFISKVGNGVLAYIFYWVCSFLCSYHVFYAVHIEDHIEITYHDYIYHVLSFWDYELEYQQFYVFRCDETDIFCKRVLDTNYRAFNPYGVCGMCCNDGISVFRFIGIENNLYLYLQPACNEFSEINYEWLEFVIPTEG